MLGRLVAIAALAAGGMMLKKKMSAGDTPTELVLYPG